MMARSARGYLWIGLLAACVAVACSSDQTPLAHRTGSAPRSSEVTGPRVSAPGMTANASEAVEAMYEQIAAKLLGKY